MFFNDPSVGNLGLVTFTDVKDSITVPGGIDIVTDWPTGHFPARTYGSNGLWLVGHPAPICTFTNVDGCQEVRDLSRLPAGLPMWSRTKQVFDKSFTGSTTGWGVTGKIRIIRVTVTTAYTGPTGTVAISIFPGHAVAIGGDGSSVNNTFGVNLKVPGVRELDVTADSYPKSWTGAQSGDTLPAAQTAPLWACGNFRVDALHNISAEASALAYTVEMICDQGFDDSGALTRSAMVGARWLSVARRARLLSAMSWAMCDGRILRRPGAVEQARGPTGANAFTTLTTAFVTEVAGDTLYVAHDHAESTAAAITLTSSGTFGSPTKIVCVDRGGTVPPVSADRRTTAQVSTTGASAINMAGFAHYDGIIFNAGTGAVGVTAHINLASTGNGLWQRFDNCSLRLNATGASNIIVTGSTSGGHLIELNNTTVSFAAVGHSITNQSIWRWRNTVSALLGTIPTVLFVTNLARGGSVECIGVDFSAAGSGKTLAGTTAGTQSFIYKFIDCKLNASVTKSTVPSGLGATEVDFIRSGASGVNYAVYRHRSSGALQEETTIVRTGGATDGTTPIAWKIDTTANCTYSMPFECPPIAIWNDTTGSAKTATVEGIWGGGAVPLDNDIWLDVEYLGDASSPQGSFVNDGTPDLLATAANQATSSVTWGGSTTKFKLAVAFTAQQKGWVYARVKCAKASSTFFIDPLVTLS